MSLQYNLQSSYVTYLNK